MAFLVALLIPSHMASTAKMLEEMREAPGSIRFADLLRVCETHLGKPRRSGGSHVVFSTPLAGDPRVNLQNDKGRAKPYQVRQALAAIDRLALEKK